MCGATVLRRKRRSDGTLVGTYNKVSILDTRLYEVQYADGTLAEYQTNNLLENLYEQIDDYGNQYKLLDAIIDHRKDENTVNKENGYITSHNGVQCKVITTKGSEMNIW